MHKNWIRNEEGATSVLVIFMMIVLVTLGAFAITSAYVNVKFSNSAVAWQAAYYDMDAEAEGYLESVDAVLIKAESAAAGYISNKGYISASYDGIPTGLSAGLADKFASAADKRLALQNAMASVYMSVAAREMSALQARYPNHQALTLADGDVVRGMVVQSTFDSHSDTNPKGHLSVSIRVNPLQYELSLARQGDGYAVQGGTAAGYTRYTIEEWKEWQTPYDYNQPQKLWDGGLEEGQADIFGNMAGEPDEPAGQTAAPPDEEDIDIRLLSI